MIKRICLLLLGFICTASIALGSINQKDLDDFKKIPVMHEGRLKPLDTYARSLLTQFSGKDHYGSKSASRWLADLIFNSEITSEDRIFLINNPDIPIALGLPVDPHRRYTPNQLKKVYRKLGQLQQQARQIPEKERSLIENDILRIFENINQYADLSRAYLFIFPQEEFSIQSKEIKKSLHLDENRSTFSFYELALKTEQLAELAKSDTEVSKLTSKLLSWSMKYKGFPFTVIPVNTEGHWLSAFDTVISGVSNSSTEKLLLGWEAIGLSYVKEEADKFRLNTQQYLKFIVPLLTQEEFKKYQRFALENFYQQSSLFTISIIFYILSFFIFLFSFINSKPSVYKIAMVCIWLGFICHTFGLTARTIIMARPPVSNLYETFIFVGFIAVLLGLCIEYYNKRWLGIVTGSICGLALLFIANKYSAEGDTLKMLVAVLDSNFWLATHVTTITMGYAATCVAGILGHVWLIQAALGKDEKVLHDTYKTTLGILGVSLTLTFLGTNLGGIWADESWGRFWGWDPKENGALMIVLWVAMLMHARISGMIDSLGVAIGAVIGMIVVMWAWFGVNLLGVGLHSYGFTSGVARSLIIYALLEVLFIIITFLLIIKKKTNP